MKIGQISLTNFSKYDAITVSFDDNVTYLIGKNGSGKSTIGISAIWFMFQGIAEKASGGNNPLIGERFRFIGPNAASAKGEMILVDENTGANIKVTRKLTKSGSDLSFEGPEGMELNQQWLTDLFNIFLIAPKKFTELSAKDQAKALGIDTKQFDDELAALKKQFTEINAVYRSYGDIAPVEKAEAVDVNDLYRRKEELRAKLNKLYQDNVATNKQLNEDWARAKQKAFDETEKFNDEQAARRLNITKAESALLALDEVGYKGNEVRDFIATLPQPEDLRFAVDFYPPEPKLVEELPDDSELQQIDLQIQQAVIANQRASDYQQYLTKVAGKEQKALELENNRKAQKEVEEKRLQYIKGFKFPFSNLSVGDDGELLLNGKPIKEPYFSTGELLKIIPILISSQNPELKYVFLQDFNLLDEDKQKEVEAHLVSSGFQLVVEMVGKSKITDKNCILLRDNVVVESYDEDTAQKVLV